MFLTKIHKVCTIVLVVLGFFGCIKSDIGNIGTDTRLNPEYAIPLGNPPIYFSSYINLFGALNPVDTAMVPDTVYAFLYENDFYEVPDSISYSISAPFSLISFEDKMQYFTSLMFRTNVANSIPAGIRLQVYFLDENAGMLDSLFTPSLTINAAEVDAEGNVSQPLVMPSVDSYLSQDQIQKISKVANVEIRTQLTIPSKKNFYSKFYDEQDFRVQLGARIKLDIPLNEF